MGRPRGLVRQALTAWAAQWRAEGREGGATIVAMAAHVPGIDVKDRAHHLLVIHTVAEMVQRGELVRVGSVSRPGRWGRPPSLYAPPLIEDEAAPSASALLASAISAWRIRPDDA